MQQPKLIFMCSAMVLGVLASAPAEGRIPDSERNALLAFFNATGGEAWTDSTGWLGSPGSECEWFGVFCDEEEQHVLELYLESNELSGHLPAELAQLPYLEALWLGRATEESPPNRLRGPIPAALGNLAQLQVLALWDNQLSGPIPAELGNLGELLLLDLDGNSLEGGIPPELGGLSRLQQLSMGAAGIGGPIPPQLAALSELRVLLLWGNQLTGGIPAELGELSQLEYLALSWNPMGGVIPPELGQLTALRGLFLWDMELTGELPPELGQLTQLEELNLGANRLSGAVPPSLGGLTRLVELNLPANQLTGSIPAELGQLESLQALRLDWNSLSGEIPKTIGNLSSLRVLGLAGNRLVGGIPSVLGNLHQLVVLGLPHNRLDGTIPSSLAHLASLQQCELQWNQLSGPVPPELGTLGELVLLNLSGNHLEGKVPAQLAELSQLRYLHLAGNQLRGPIPTRLVELGQLEDGEGLELRWNALSNSDAELEAFLSIKQADGDWRSTQTVAPTEMELVAVRPDAAEIAWRPIVYSWDDGGTRVLLATTAGGPYTLHGSTPSKETADAVLDGLQPATQYFLVLQSVTEPHAMNRNLVESLPSDELSFTTGKLDDCALSCAAEVAAEAIVHEEVSFSGSVSSSNCDEDVELRWQFGDGSTAVGEAVEHGYAAAGRYPWAMWASSGDAGCTATGTISVLEPDTECGNGSCEAGESAWSCASDCGFASQETGRAGASSALSALPAAVAGVAGVGGTFWVSEALLHNPGAEAASLRLSFTPDSQPAASTTVGPLHLDAGGAAFFGDFVTEVFGVEGNGSVIVESDRPLMVVSRTFNQQPDGSYGQFLGAVPFNRMLAVGDLAVLPGLSENDAFRSNVLVQDVSGQGSTVALAVYDSAAELMGRSTLSIAAGCKLQKRLLSLGYSALDHGFATLEVVSGGQVVALASVVDEGTGDAMTVDAVHAEQVLFGSAAKGIATATWLRAAVAPAPPMARASVDFSWSPANPSVGDPVSFSNLTQGSGISFAWSFGDGATSNDENPVHTYDEAGTLPVTLAVSTSDFGSSFSTKTISVQESVSFDSSYLVAVVARSPGAGGTQWRSDLWLLNPLDGAQDVRLEYHPEGSTVERLHDLVLPGGQQVAVEDVVGRLFPDAGDGKGSLHVRASQGIVVSSRTYNLGDDGTFGQAIPALGAGDLVAAGLPGKLLKLKNTKITRCNVGFAEMDGLGAELELSLFAVRDDGVVALGSKRYTVAASTLRQVNRVFTDMGVEDSHEAAYAVVEWVSGGRVYAYASNVDERTGDGEFIPAMIR